MRMEREREREREREKMDGLGRARPIVATREKTKARLVRARTSVALQPGKDDGGSGETDGEDRR